MLKKALTTTLVLTHWVPNTQIILETNASDYALTAILSIISLDDSKVVRFYTLLKGDYRSQQDRNQIYISWLFCMTVHSVVVSKE